MSDDSPTPVPEPLLSTTDVAKLLSVHPHTVLRLVKHGQLPRPVIDHGKVHRWRMRDLTVHFDRVARLRV